MARSASQALPAPADRRVPAPLFHWLNDRLAGVLLHPTALPSAFGVGAFDDEARKLIDFFAEAGIGAWQICPLGPTGYGDSPYQCFSAFAGNPYLVDPAALVTAGLVTEEAVRPLRQLDPDHVDFGALFHQKLPLLFSAYDTWRRDRQRALPYGDFAEFRQRHASWLSSYGLFSALKEHFGGRAWWDWPVEARTLAAARKSPHAAQVADRAEAYEFIQYLFFGQWALIREHARDRGVLIIGDAPIFAALDSADVWAHPELFQLDPKTSRPTAVAGVPPDYFSADGQLWGNPLYDWPAHADDDYAWWLARLRANFELYDVVRIDHFRGFDTYWSIPAGAPNARTGRWENGPGLAFFEALRATLPDAKLIAEDLGELVPSVIALREATGLPGMVILQFAFGSGPDNLYLPHNHRANSVVYPGTHDNDTTLGWYATLGEGAQDHVRRYLRVSGREIGWDFVRAAYASVCRLAIIPLQDLFTLGSEARFNTPGTSQGNWAWRYRREQLNALRNGATSYLRELALLYGREPQKPKPAEPGE
ncbi:4-alpha-glucanotransferase [Opitutus terrae]|uniref:4-alpha-glucanotransferase n=1 Tax=Opitutus terrae (strain DSM 11246 / JCM 15787 / PB90-1) TaxID=452637 RepID=B1ZTA1_OPITP|nr:4-alpha-glucanotransferase [Opitutus terrae]ACB76555.1 4-alpha-glucanotransferase [Opitutus terrae PB90-1]